MVQGVSSSVEAVKSGVPQGSVLGPTLFILYVNKLPELVQSNMKMFADDVKLYRKIESHTDFEILQDDINTLCEWSKKWLLQFNIQKCKVMHCGSSNPKFKYKMHGEDLQTTDTERDIGITITSDLKPSIHCQRAANKGMAALRVLRGCFDRLTEQNFAGLFNTYVLTYLLTYTYKVQNLERPHGLMDPVISSSLAYFPPSVVGVNIVLGMCPVSIEHMYEHMYVRPHLDYCIQAVGPQAVQDLDLLEKVQRRATKLVKELRHPSYPARLKRLRTGTIRERIKRGDLIETYKILTGKLRTRMDKFFSLKSATTRGHHLKLEKKRVTHQARLRFFSQRVVNSWNKLPEEVISVCTTETFKAKLDKSLQFPT